MPPYRYQPLSSKHDSIRLLRLLPNRDKNAEIRCELFEYSLKNMWETHQYEALSYVWGDANNKLPLFIHEHRFDATANLFAALSQLRNHTLERILWIDAICIDQQNLAEKECQIQFMATIYARAYRVIVWLGEASNDSDLVFEEIRRSEGKISASVVKSSKIGSAGVALLQRTWFRRIWILQEVAAARNVVIMCGPQKIDGYAFCLGVDDLINAYDTHPDFPSLVRSVTYLIRGANFRPDYSLGFSSRSTLNISPLSELIDMYHANEATQCHDKVYALLGMSTDDLSEGHLSPDYRLPWAELLQRLVKHVISEQLVVETWEDNQAAVIKSRGYVLGEVISVERDPVRGDRCCVEILLYGGPGRNGAVEQSRAHWTLQATATTIQARDILCLLRGASKPTIIRLVKDHFKVVMVAVNLPEKTQKSNEHGKHLAPESFARLPDRNFLLVWDWEQSSRKTLHSEQYDTWIRKIDWGSKQSRLEMESQFSRATRLWEVTLILGDIAALVGRGLRSSQMEERGREAVKDFEIAIISKGLCTSKFNFIQALLIPALEVNFGSKDAAADILLKDASLYPSLEASDHEPQPLYWAAMGEHGAVVELLLDSMHEPSQDLLQLAASNGHEAATRVLLQRDKANLETKNVHGSNALALAAHAGHEAIVRLLLATCNVDVNNVDLMGCTPLFQASVRGHQAVVKLLLETDTIDVNAKNKQGEVPLSMAIVGGYENVARLLLETDQIDVKVADRHGDTALSHAASRGQEAVVVLLLENGHVDVGAKNIQGQTPLFRAIDGGHDNVVRLLLGTGKIDLKVTDKHGQTPLVRAINEAQQAEPLSPTVLSRVENEWGMLNWPSERKRKGLQAVITTLRKASEVEAESQERMRETSNTKSKPAESLYQNKRVSQRIARGRKWLAKQ